MSDWPAWITIIVAIATPAITSAITMRHNRKMKKIEIVYDRKIAAINNMCLHFKHAIDSSFREPLWEFFSAVYQVIAFFGPEIASELFDMLDVIDSEEIGEREKTLQFRKCLELLSREMKKQGKI